MNTADVLDRNAGKDVSAAACPAAAVQMDAGASRTFKILFARISDKKPGEHKQPLRERGGVRKKLAYIPFEVSRHQAVRIRDGLDVVPRVFRQAMVVERGTVGVNTAPLPKQPYAASRTVAGAAA